jgi:hypothetical protein
MTAISNVGKIAFRFANISRGFMLLSRYDPVAVNAIRRA